MRLIENLSKKELNELVGKCWITHDGMWFYHSVQEFGIEKTNQINLAAIRAMVPFELHRFKAAMGIRKEHLDSYEELVGFFGNAIELLIPDFMNVTWAFPSENIIQWSFNEKKCFAYKGINRLGVLDKYECGPITRVRCWLEHLGVKYTVDPDIKLCVMNEKENCSGEFRLSF
jgi:hypothetical protein